MKEQIKIEFEKFIKGTKLSKEYRKQNRFKTKRTPMIKPNKF